MEKAKQERGNQTHEKPKSLVWDCGSSLYDSFELKSLERQLYSAISSRTLSMPHLSGRRVHTPPPPPPPQPRQPVQTQHVVKKSSKFSKPFQRLLRSIFGPKQTHNSLFRMKDCAKGESYYPVFDGSGALYTIPEVAESGGEHHGGSPDFGSALVGRSSSDRFSRTTCIRVSCA
ncbi:hypothetical protein Vadar_026744 [Vaccinium darrowii]|uniref:Uncharacterized protein n=1 Tax=Vaccinium darrowii TaxID=229202 RepID=A0ACB7XKK3_9ERIC|nr:hypothetical protein Vadar_026744 [Vaccinium darrowii]